MADYSFSTLPNELKIQIALELDRDELYALCLTDWDTSGICNDENFWMRRMEIDTPNSAVRFKNTWKKSWIVIEKDRDFRIILIRTIMNELRRAAEENPKFRYTFEGLLVAGSSMKPRNNVFKLVFEKGENYSIPLLPNSENPLAKYLNRETNKTINDPSTQIYIYVSYDHSNESYLVAMVTLSQDEDKIIRCKKFNKVKSKVLFEYLYQITHVQNPQIIDIFDTSRYWDNNPSLAELVRDIGSIFSEMYEFFTGFTPPFYNDFIKFVSTENIDYYIEDYDKVAISEIMYYFKEKVDINLRESRQRRIERTADNIEKYGEYKEMFFDPYRIANERKTSSNDFYTSSEMRKILGRYGLSTKGKKKDLVRRLDDLL